MMVDLLFIDYRAEGFARYANDIAKELKKRQEMVIAAVYVEKRTDVFENSYDSIDEIFSAQEYKLDAGKIIDNYQPKAILVFAHRFLDYLFTSEAHKRNITVFNFQHGIYMKHTVISDLNSKNMKRLVSNKKNKIRQYIKCLYLILDKNIFRLFKALILLRKGVSLYDLIHREIGNRCEADISFIYGEYWCSYYKQMYLEKLTRFVIVGYPELEKPGRAVEKLQFKDRDRPIVCYLAQTAVEDGTVTLTEFQSFLGQLTALLDRINLVIKFHPRSDYSLYEKLFSDANKQNVFAWNEPEFPKADYYIGHDTAVLARALDITARTLICELSAERHNLFGACTHFVAGPGNDLSKCLDDMIESKDKADLRNDILSNYAWKNPKGALNETAQIISENMQREKI